MNDNIHAEPDAESIADIVMDAISNGILYADRLTISILENNGFRVSYEPADALPPKYVVLMIAFGKAMVKIADATTGHEEVSSVPATVFFDQLQEVVSEEGGTRTGVDRKTLYRITAITLAPDDDGDDEE